MTFDPKPHQMQIFTPEFPTSSATHAQEPDPRTAEIASDQRGLSAGEADKWARLEIPTPRQTPGVPPMQLRRGLDAHVEFIGGHNARRPSPQNNQNAGLAEVADKRRQEELKRNAAALHEGHEGKATLSQAIPPTVAPEEPPQPGRPQSGYEQSRGDQPQFSKHFLDELLLRF